LRIGLDARELQGRPTGTGRYLRSLLRCWPDTGEDTLIAYFNGRPPEAPIPSTGRLELRAVGDGRQRGLLWQQRALPEAARLDGLNVFFSPAYTCPLPLQVPRVTAVHDLSYFARPEEFPFWDGLRRRLLGRASMRASARVLACSAFTRREIGARFPELAARVRHVPLGADDDLLPAPPRELARARLRITGPLLLAVGTLLHRRCIPELLRAVARLLPTLPELRLHLIGENRTHPFRDFQALVDELGLRRNVELLGFVDEAALADRYAAADVALALSDYEGFGLPALEALARGVPLVAADRPALNEVVGGAALLVNPRDPAAIADAVSEVLADEALRGSLQARGRARAARFSWSEAAQQTREELRAAALSA
jgi:glycosyltransferase involved in cell wall biosynthesis